jgi:predicted component of type VI protein secretion system
MKLGDNKLPTSSLRIQRMAELEVESFGKFCIENVATIGRSPDSHVVLDNRSVSRHHARIFYEGGHYWIKDLESRNGTTVNGQKTKLQMLNDSDKVNFGEVKSVFKTGAQNAGPARLGRDPLEGSELAFEDGTPTGGLAGSHRSMKAEESQKREAPATRTMAIPAAAGEGEASLEEHIRALKAENDLLKRQIQELRSPTAGTRSAFEMSSASESLIQENERLRRQVSQLERALADSNVRLRNLQARLDSCEGSSR